MNTTRPTMAFVLLGLLCVPALTQADETDLLCDSIHADCDLGFAPGPGAPDCPDPFGEGDLPSVPLPVWPCALPVQAPICDLPALEDFQFTVRTVSEALPDMDAVPLSPGEQSSIAQWAYDQFNALVGILDCLSKPAGHYLITFDFDSGGVQRLNLGLAWHDSGAGRTFMQYWTLPLFSSPSGPYGEEYALVGAPSVQDTNYAGREYWKGTDWVSQAVHDVRVPTITNPNVAPTNVPAGYAVNPVLVIWIGVSPGAGGVGGLAQTGIIKDTANAANGDYSAFYEFHDGGPALTKFPGPLNIPPGDYSQQMIQQDDVPNGKCCIKFDAVVKDLTAKKGATALFSTGKINYEAKRALYMAETPTYRQAPPGQPTRDVYQQMPSLSAAIGFYDAWFYDQKTNYAYETRSGGISSQSDILVQSRLASPNTADAWVTGSGGYFNRAGYHTVTRLSSAYDWNCAMLKPNRC